jgi:hypothetical protein
VWISEIQNKTKIEALLRAGILDGLEQRNIKIIT